MRADVELSSGPTSTVPQDESSNISMELRSETEHICSACGIEISGSHDFCPHCGGTLKTINLPIANISMANKPWGFWPTIGLTIVSSVPALNLSMLIAFLFVIVGEMTNPAFSTLDFFQSGTPSGLYISLSMVVSAPLSLWLIVIFAKGRPGFKLSDYLGLKKVPYKDYAKWVGITFAYMLASGMIAAYTGRPIPEFMKNTFETAGFLPLLLLSVIVVAPLLEEFTIRGFLFTGIKHSKAGSIGAIVLTAAVWSLAHTGQYDLFYILSIFVMGLIMGFARDKTDSIYIPIAMHVFNNLVSTVAFVLGLNI